MRGVAGPANGGTSENAILTANPHGTAAQGEVWLIRLDDHPAQAICVWGREEDDEDGFLDKDWGTLALVQGRRDSAKKMICQDGALYQRTWLAFGDQRLLELGFKL